MSTAQRHKITRRLIGAAKPAAKDYFLWDSVVSGFGVRVWPSGRKVFVFQYRSRPKTTRRPTIGVVGAITPERARDIAREWGDIVRKGGNPKDRQVATVAELADRYMEEHARPKKRPRSVESDETNLRLHVLPALGKYEITTITRADISAMHHDMRGTPGAANRVLSLTSKMFNLAEKWGLRPQNSNPCRHVERFGERKLERFLSAEELGRLGAALSQAEAEKSESKSVIACIKLLIFTGARKGEILGLRWDQVDLENGILRLEQSKTGPKTIYLPAPAFEVLEKIERQPDNPYVIVGAKAGQAFTNITLPWYRIRKRAGLDDVRLHDLRHSFAAMGAGGGLSLPVIGALLGHTQPSTTQRYAHLAADPLRQASESIGGRIAAAMKSTQADVVPIRKRKG